MAEQAKVMSQAVQKVGDQEGKYLTFSSQDAPAETGQKLRLPKGDETILFVDDEQVLVDLATEILEHLGYEVVSRLSSVDALEAFRSQPQKFDLILTDQTMPQMTGADLAAAIIGIRPDTPIILCSGLSELLTPEKERLNGFREILMKPFVIRDLATTVRRVLDEETPEDGNGALDQTR